MTAFPVARYSQENTAGFTPASLRATSSSTWSVWVGKANAKPRAATARMIFRLMRSRKSRCLCQSGSAAK